jgi:hypothetical protein
MPPLCEQTPRNNDNGSDENAVKSGYWPWYRGNFHENGRKSDADNTNA